MNNSEFYSYAKKFGDYQKHSMFGGIGLFLEDAMFVLITNDSLYLRGGKLLDSELSYLGCERYRHVKKQTVVTVNYYNISKLFNQNHTQLDSLINQSIHISIKDRLSRKSADSRRLRDLPNMRLTLERMVKKSGIVDVHTFMECGAVEVYRKVQCKYGDKTDISLLWKFAGAVEGIHWKLLTDTTKNELKRSCNLA